VVATIEKKPFPVRAINGLHAGLVKLGLSPIRLDKEHLKRRASKAAGGLTDFGDPRYEEFLERMLANVESNERLSGLGRIMASQYTQRLLRQRLQIVDYLAKNPGVKEEKIERPIFIIGSARTGTTITHQLIGCDERIRFPFTWECDDVYPPLDPRTMHSDPRIAASQKGIDQTMVLAPEIDAAHPMGAWEAQECALLTALDFASQALYAMFNIPDYMRWVERQDQTWIYENHKTMLQYLQSGGLRPTESWLLKSPPHMARIDEILRVYPDARFITTYREPTEIVVSGCSLMGTVMQMAHDSIDWTALGEFVAWLIEHDMRVNVEQRRRHADLEDRFVDISMQAMIADPLGSVRRIYDQFGIEMTEQADRAMTQHMEERHLSKRKKHAYSAEEFGLDVAELWPRFDFYRAFYGIERHPPG